MKVFIWFLFFLPIVYAADNYDYFQLVLQWPPTVCRSNCPPFTTHMPQNFTIHGLWPSNSTEPQLPRDCPGPRFNSSEIDDLKPDLRIYWPNLTGDNEYFWGNQWETHGTCSYDKFNEREYFSKALELKKDVDILGYLAAGGIKPLPPKAVYRSREISDVIEHGTGDTFRGTGHLPRLWCEDNKLLEISVCYDETLANVRDCPPKLINYPENKCNECVGFPLSPAS